MFLFLAITFGLLCVGIFLIGAAFLIQAVGEFSRPTTIVNNGADIKLLAQEVRQQFMREIQAAARLSRS